LLKPKAFYVNQIDGHNIFTMKEGVSVIICCHNSSNKLSPTLIALSKQTGIELSITELIIIDNNSTDDTTQVAQDIWNKLGSPFQLNCIKESKTGLSYARLKGIKCSKFGTIIFVDDDNELYPDYIQIAHQIMQSNNNIGAIGGEANLPIEYDKIFLPKWFDQYYSALALGKPKHRNNKPVYLYGAGLCLNKINFQKLLSNGFQFQLTGRKGNEILAGEDTELCLALRICNFELIYCPSLQLIHRIDKNRITKEYFRKLTEGFGKSHIYLGVYHNILRFGFSTKWMEIIISYSIHFYKLIRYSTTTSQNKEFQLIISRNRINEINNIPYIEYNKMVKILRKLSLNIG
jgi:glycosyltransferase involved in cell wall biosynthesis